MVRFRALEGVDVDLMFAVENDSTAWRDGETQAPFPRSYLAEYIAGYNPDPFAAGQLRLVAEVKSGEAWIPAGLFDFYDISARHRRAFVAIYVLPEFRRRGIASEILAAGMEYARRVLMLEAIGAKMLSGNEASRRLFEGAGFERAGMLKCWHRAEGEAHDMLLYQSFPAGI